MSTAISVQPQAARTNKQMKESFPVLEMTCAACAVSVESMLKSVPGVTDAGVNFANQSAWVQYDPVKVSPEMLQNSVRSIGYDLLIDKENQEEEYIEIDGVRWMNKKLIHMNMMKWKKKGERGG